MHLDGQISYAIWLQLPVEIREKLVRLFGIPKSGRTVVEYRISGAVVTSDGYTAPDLQSISLAKMQALLDTDDTNYYKLFEDIINHIDALIGGTYEKGVVFYDDPHFPSDILKAIGETSKDIEKTKFCNQCDSKGGRHKKVCPKYA